MLRELISLIISVEPLREMGNSFAEMLRVTRQQTLDVGDAFFEGKGLPDICARVRNEDVQVNALRMKIREQVAAHLSVKGNSADLPYCLLLISLVKDVERIGDHAKNLCEVRGVLSGRLPEDDLAAELREIRNGVESSFELLATVFEQGDKEQALELIRQGQEFARRCDVLLTKVAQSAHDSATVAVVATGTRCYKRIGGHVLNVLSSVVMPLHKLDYYDEDAIQERFGH